MLTTVGGRKLPRSTRIAFLRSTSLGCSTWRSGANIAAPLSPSWTSLSAISRLSTDRNSMPCISIMSISMRPVVSGSSRLSTICSGSWCWKNARVQQVDADDAERLLLLRGLVVEHPHVEHDLAGLVPRVGLELHAHPAVALVAAAVAAGDHGVGEGEERRVVAALVAEPVQVELELVVEHRLQPTLGDVAVGLAVDRVADRHVVGRHRLGDRAGGSAGAEEPAGDLLAGADLGDRAVPAQIEVDLQGLLQGVRCRLPCRSPRSRPVMRPALAAA